ncbi:hypothetical protein IFM89_026716, partial [Coptis chinensis]
KPSHDTVGFKKEVERITIDLALQWEKDISLSGGYAREGLTSVISVKVPNPEFEGQTKAILPLRGKILNIERKDEAAMYKNQEIQNLILAFGPGVKGEDFKKEALRYHKIIIMTDADADADADVDGAHIRILLLTFFYIDIRKLYLMKAAFMWVFHLSIRMSERNVFSWTSIIGLYCEVGDYEETIELFYLMIKGVVPNRFIFPKVYKACSELKIYRMEVAREFFEKMELKDVVVWNIMISGNEQNGRSYQALQVFSQMIMERVKPNSITIASAVSACTNLSLLQHGKEIHAYCIKTDRLVSDLLVANSLVDLYAKCRIVKVARRKFNSIKQKDLISWNAMLADYAEKGCREETFELFNEMKSLGVEPDVITWNGLITACSLVKDLKLGKEIHGFVIRKQIELSTGVGSALITMYSGCDHMEWACSVFNVLSDKDVVVWNSIISACAQHGQGVSALNFLRGMLVSDIEPNKVTIVSVLPACARLAALRQGKEIHQFIIRRGFDMHIAIWNGLIDMNGRCYGMHGFGMDAVNLFFSLRSIELKPNHFTFTNLLAACSHSGLIDEGWKYFEMMKSEYAMGPAIEQYAWMVDLLAQAGQFDESLEFIKEMPFEPNAAVWGSLLGACRIHCNPELAEYAAGYLFELEPTYSGNYILLANIYSAAERWGDAARIRILMKDRGVTKPPGCSWIEVKRSVHSFIVGDTSHSLVDEISAKLNSLYSEIKEIGYVPDTFEFVKHLTISGRK